MSTKYKRLQQLGEKGKEAKTYLVLDHLDCQYAMKTFRKNKSSKKLVEEVKLQRKCSDAFISPRVVDYSVDEKFIVMEKMDSHLYSFLIQSKGILPLALQQQLIYIFKTLDKIKVFHGDANILNYMLKGNRIYLIDFGYSKSITPSLKKKLESEHPNYELMLLGFILKLKDLKCPPESYAYLKTHLSAQKRRQFKI